MRKKRDSVTTAERLEELRAETSGKDGRPLSQEAFAAQLGMSRQAYQFWLKGRTPNGDSLREVAKTFGVTIDWILGINGAPKFAKQWEAGPKLEELVAERVKRLVAKHASYFRTPPPWLKRFQTATIDGEKALLTAAMNAYSQLDHAYGSFSGPSGRYVSADMHARGYGGALARAAADMAPLWDSLGGEAHFWRDLAVDGMIRPGPKALQGDEWWTTHVFIDPTTGEYIRRDLRTGVDVRTGQRLPRVRPKARKRRARS